MKIWKVVLAVLSLTVGAVWLALGGVNDQFHLIVCDVGQGDAILATFKSTQVLIDGGPNNQVVDCLGQHLPFWDREIELVVLTHPEEDHYRGLIEVVRRYRVGTLLTTNLEHQSGDYQLLVTEVKNRGIKVVNPVVGQEIEVGLISLDILWPSQTSLAVLGASPTTSNPNDYSIVSRLSFGTFDILLAGDIQPPVTDQTVPQVLGLSGEIEVLKIPHHGSKNGLTDTFLKVVNPKLAVISVGKNAWGHPHQEILKLLEDRGITTYRTDKTGEVEIETDGITWGVVK